MNQEVISIKLLSISFIISVSLLAFIFVLKPIYRKPILAFCNINNRLNVLLQIENNDILINPLGTKEVLECLGKHMPYYDRTIEVVITDKNELITQLKERYHINQISKEKEIYLAGNLISIDSNIAIKNQNGNLLICQRPLTKITKELLNADFSFLLRGKTDIQFKKIIMNQHIAENGEIGRISLDLFRTQ